MRTAHILVAVLTALLAILAWRFLIITEILKEVKTYGPVMCLKMPSSQAPEDTQRIPGTRHVLMGVDDRMTLWHTPGKGPNDTYPGGITTMKLPKDMADYPLIHPVDIKDFPKDVAFHPLGLHLRNETLYAINNAYQKGGERVELFKIEGFKTSQLGLKWEKSIQLPEYMYGIANDLVFISDTEFFITTWHSKPDGPEGRSQCICSKLRIALEYLLGLEWTYLYRCKAVEGEAQCKAVASGLLMNGVTLRGEELWVADTVGRNVRRLKVEPEAVVEMERIETEYGVDNMEYDPATDKIFMGVQARAWDYADFIQKAHSGLKPEGGITGGCDELDPKTGSIRHILMQEKQNAVSSCARTGMFIVMGSWQDNHVLVCPLEDPKK